MSLLNWLIMTFSSIRYCGALDGVLAGHVTDVSSAEQKHLFHQFLSLSMSSGKYQVPSSTLCCVCVIGK